MTNVLRLLHAVYLRGPVGLSLGLVVVQLSDYLQGRLELQHNCSREPSGSYLVF